MTKNFYLVEFEFEYPVAAEDETDAKEYIREALSDAGFLEDYCLVGPLKSIPSGWEEDLEAQIYGEDITLAEVFEIIKERKREEKLKKDIPGQVKMPFAEEI
jgi:hypothetical protein